MARAKKKKSIHPLWLKRVCVMMFY